MENLTKQQIVLVMILVSFVTSIATGVVTVSLMDDETPSVTQTVNRVVERTIERVVPVETSPQKATVKETIVVKADDQAVTAVAKALPGIVRIFAANSVGEDFAGLGLILSQEGLIVAPRSIYSSDKSYTGIIEKNRYPLALTSINGETDTVTFTLSQSEKKTFTPVNFGDSSNLKLGQTVIMIGGSENPAISMNVVAALGHVITLDTSSTDTVLGAALLNFMGEVVGFKNTMNDEARRSYILADILKKHLPNSSI